MIGPINKKMFLYNVASVKKMHKKVKIGSINVNFSVYIDFKGPGIFIVKPVIDSFIIV